jgi:hypothetical protein
VGVTGVAEDGWVENRTDDFAVTRSSSRRRIFSLGAEERYRRKSVMLKEFASSVSTFRSLTDWISNLMRQLYWVSNLEFST